MDLAGLLSTKSKGQQQEKKAPSTENNTYGIMEQWSFSHTTLKPSTSHIHPRSSFPTVGNYYLVEALFTPKINNIVPESNSFPFPLLECGRNTFVPCRCSCMLSSCFHTSKSPTIWFPLSVGEVPLYLVGILVCCQVFHVSQNTFSTFIVYLILSVREVLPCRFSGPLLDGLHTWKFLFSPSFYPWFQVQEICHCTVKWLTYFDISCLSP